MKRARLSIAGMMGFVLIVALGLGGLKAANPIWASSCFSVAFASLVAAVLMAVHCRSRRRAFFLGFAIAGWPYFLLTVLLMPVLAGFQPPRLLTTLLLDEVRTLFFPTDNNTFFTTTFNPPAMAPVPLLPPVPPTAPPMPSVPPPDSSVLSSDSPDSNPSVPPVPAVAPAPAPPAASSAPVGFTLAPTFVNGNVATASFSTIPGGSGTGVPFMTMTGTLSGTISHPYQEFEQVGQSMATLLFAYLGGLFSLFLAARRKRNEAIPAADVSPSSP